MTPVIFQDYFSSFFNLVKYNNSVVERINKINKRINVVQYELFIIYFVVKAIAYFAVLILMSLTFSLQRISFFKNDKENMAEVLFVSHATANNLKNSSDQFFGDIINQVSTSKNVQTIYLKQNKLSFHYNLFLLRKVKKHQVTLIPKFLNPKETFYFILQTIKQMILILTEGKKKIPTICFAERIEKTLHLFSRETYNNYRIYFSCLRSLKINKPKIVFTLFEGWPYEEIIKTISLKAGCKFISYQHSAILPNQISLQRRLKSIENEETIFCSGTAFLKYFKSVNQNIPTYMIGSSRKISKEDRSNCSSLLLTPEAQKFEVTLFINLVKDLLRLGYDSQVVIRFHPNYRVKNVTKIKLKILKKKYSNFQISRDKLSMDLAKAKYIVYRGTTTVYEAIMQGCEPLFYDTKELYENNALALINILHHRISNASDLLLLDENLQKSRNSDLKIFETLETKTINDFLRNSESL